MFIYFQLWAWPRDDDVEWGLVDSDVESEVERGSSLHLLDGSSILPYQYEPDASSESEESDCGSGDDPSSQNPTASLSTW